MSTPNFIPLLSSGIPSLPQSRAPCPTSRSAAGDDADTAVHRQPLAGDVLAGVRGEQQRDALEVFVVAQALQRRVGGQLVLAQRLERACVILLGKKPGQMALTVMLYLPHSQPSARVKLITAPLEVL